MTTDGAHSTRVWANVKGLLLALVVVAYYLGCISIPFAMLESGRPWGAVATGIGLPLAWMLTMPTTCWSGGFLWSLLGCQMLLVLCGWTLFGVILLGFAVFG